MFNELAAEIAGLLNGGGYNSARLEESDLQNAGFQRLLGAGLQAELERTVGKNRYDIWVNPGVVVEVKVDGSKAAVLAQLARYAMDPDVIGLVLLTTKARHLSLTGKVVNGKRIEVAHAIRF